MRLRKIRKKSGLKKEAGMHLPWDKRRGKSGCVDERIEVVIADDLYVY